MNSRLRIEKAIFSFIAWITMAGLVFGQQPPSAVIEKAQVVVNQNGKPEHIHLEFGLKTAFAVSEARLFYRGPDVATFSETKLKRAPTLRYIASIPPVRMLEYFIELTPERGPRQQIGTEESPFRLDSSTLDKVSKTKGSKAAIIVTVVTVVIAAIFGAGVARRKKGH